MSPDPADTDLDPLPWRAGLTTKQRRFVEEYCVDFCATQAAVRAGYSERTARSIGWENLTKPDISRALAKRMAALCMSSEEALARLSEMARADISDAFAIRTDGAHPSDPEYAVIDLVALLRGSKSHLVKSISFTRNGPKVEMYDAQAALDKIMRAHGAYKDRVDLTSGDKEITGVVFTTPGQSE